MMATEFVPDIIRLQLKKPKSWNWQLSTSKSSPHITLPIIQLYDYKGQLLVEARDESGNGLRRSWGPNVGGILEGKFPREIPNHLKRCRSDTLDFEKCDLLNGIIEQNEKGGTEQNRIDSMLSTSKSKRSSRRNFKELDVKSQDENKSRRHRRSKSDDLFRRKLRYSSEESVKRAEIDGYRNFITPNIPTKEPQLQPPTQNKPNKNGSVLQCSENVLVECNPSSLEESGIKHKRYKTRTCSAGTLVITDESFYAQRSGRRRRRSDRVSADFPVPETAAVPARGNSAIYRPQNRSCSAPYPPKSENACLFYSKSDVFLFGDSIAANGRRRNPEKVGGNPCGGESRTVTAGRSSKDENSEAMIEKLNGKKPRKFRREAYDSSTSSSVKVHKGGDGMRKSKVHLATEPSTILLWTVRTRS